MSFPDNDVVNFIFRTLEKELGSYGFEFHPFKVAWYNALVQPIFKLGCSEDTLAFLVISSPRMFEDAFVPFLKNRELSGLKDPIDECMIFYLSKISQVLPYNVRIIYDFELHPNRRPKLVMQSIAHASGAAYYYHPKCVANYDWPNKKVFGVCIHPKYGGWFALRAVAFFDDVQCPSLPNILPKDVVPSTEDRIKLLEMYNFNWKDWKFRDIIPVSEKYSELQIKYFSAPPNKRGEIIKYIQNIVNITNRH